MRWNSFAHFRELAPKSPNFFRQHGPTQKEAPRITQEGFLLHGPTKKKQLRELRKHSGNQEVGVAENYTGGVTQVVVHVSILVPVV